MTLEYLKCKADLNLEVDFGVKDTTSTIVTKHRILFYSDNGLFSTIIHIF